MEGLLLSSIFRIDRVASQLKQLYIVSWSRVYTVKIVWFLWIYLRLSAWCVSDVKEVLSRVNTPIYQNCFQHYHHLLNHSYAYLYQKRSFFTFRIFLSFYRLAVIILGILESTQWFYTWQQYNKIRHALLSNSSKITRKPSLMQFFATLKN